MTSQLVDIKQASLILYTVCVCVCVCVCAYIEHSIIIKQTMMYSSNRSVFFKAVSQKPGTPLPGRGIQMDSWV